MTIKPKKPKSRRNFGTRRQWRRTRGTLGQWINVDFETYSFGIDVGRKDVTAVAVVSGLYPHQVEMLHFLEAVQTGRVRVPVMPPVHYFPSRFFRASSPKPVPLVETVDYSVIEARIMAHLADKTGIAESLQERLKEGPITLPLDKELLADLRDIKKSD